VNLPHLIAQGAEAASTPLLLTYGPLGLGWLGMSWFINKLIMLHKSREDELMKRDDARDKLIRDTMGEQAEAYNRVAHAQRGVSKHMLFVVAATGHESLKKLAEMELVRMNTDKT
jgi:hypothetical protein